MPALDGRTVLVTGASTGIGRTTALMLAELGATVLAGVRNTAAGEALGPTVRPVQLDITNPDDIAALDLSTARRARQQRRDRDQRPARVPAGRRAAPPAGGQRDRPARRHPGLSPGAPTLPRADREHLLDRRARRAAALRPVLGVQVRPRGAERFAAARAARVRHPRHARRARGDRDADLGARDRRRRRALERDAARRARALRHARRDAARRGGAAGCRRASRRRP